MVSREDRYSAEHEITRLMHLYVHRLDGADFGGVAALFDDAVWRISPERACRGSAEVQAWLEENLTVHGDKLGTRHIISGILTEVADDGLTATSWSYGVVTQVTDQLPIQVISQCRYEDSFALTDGQWRFAERRVHLDGFGNLSAHQRHGW